ncbi:hypothetical protein MMRN_38380 [Mycobacterium marinum]|uniref:tape measure protein n=3 Tax=Mycobacterium marinum TaxID=1781 RepID=UPI000CD9A182|nr:tape measure protein [Mycobacterium marinum]AXN50933.1 hypothetical protein CCUG20998_03531 [Mycobacterium marinum]RFZ25469.1 hypothetical protein DSM43519_01655 [Mycobacterium marinum]RFZ28356.1 hypothetical protein DSM44344_01401 [Mycobacterium marinum]WOR02984.1 tape measure protein [Mycobacterium marinum]BBC66942.1 hypothetical protein MMRN_38380 [Mycobacterium marinum]
MAIHADVLARLNERAADQVASQLEARFRVAGERSSQAFSQALTARSAIDQAVTQFAAHGQRAARGFGSGFGSELTRALPVVSGFSSAMAGYETAAGKSGALAGRAFGMAFTTAAAGLVGAAGYTLFKGFERYEAIDAAKNRLDNLNRTLTATGKQALDVGAVMDTVNQVVLDTPFKLDEAFSVATRALASSTGDLQRFMTDVSNAAGFTGSSISDIGDAFLKVANQGHVSMQEINNQLQQLPIVPWLADTLTGGDVPKLAKMIHDNKVGLEALLTTVEQHAPGFAKAMNNTVAGSIENVKTSIARLGANFLGAIFGKPAEDANQLVDIMQALREHIDEIGEWVSQHQNDIRDFFKNAAAIGGELVEVFGKIAKALSDHPGLVYAVIAAWAAFKAANIAGNIAGIITKVTALNTAMGALPEAASTAAAGMGTAFGPIALMLAGVAAEFGAIYLAIRNAKIEMPAGTGLPPGATTQQRQVFAQGGTSGLNSIPRSQGGLGPEPGEPGYVPPGSTPGSATPPRYYPFGLKGPSYVWVPGKGYQPEGFVAPGAGPSGNPILDPTGAAGGASGPRLPKAPVVPFDMSVPPGIPGLPQTAATYSAETSFLESRHRLAEKRARLNQLEHTANATAEDILDARNDVLEAQRSQQQAEMRLAEARQNELEKYTKHMRQGADTLGQIGAQLDQDFGISKGLAGIAENITKFIANLAAAPVIGALSGVQQGLGYKPGEAGSGLLAMAAGAGAFGPQHQVLPYGGQYPYAAAGMPVAGVGMPGTPNLAGVSYGVPAGANIYSGPHTTDTHGALTPRAAALRSLISQMFGVTNIGGYRPPDPPFNEHSSGEALDIMVGDNAALGDQINQFLQDNAGPLGLEYSLWQQQQWTPGQGPTPMENRGSGTQNHRDHVHARVRPGPLAGGGGQVAPSGWGGGAPTGGGPGWWGGGTPGAPGGGDSPIPGAPGTPGVPFPGTQSPLVPGGGGPGLPGQARGPMTPGRGRMPGQGLNIPKSEGIGIGGGLPGLLQSAVPTAISAAGAAAGMAAPGAGAGGSAAGAIISAAAQIGIDEINRAIGFGAQAAGIGVGGLLETFVPNESALADFSGGWFGRIAGAVAGVNAQVPNIAGQVGQAINGATGGQGLPPGLTPEQVAGNPDQRSGDQSGGQGTTINNNLTYNNNSPIQTEDRMGADLSNHLGSMYQR